MGKKDKKEKNNGQKDKEKKKKESLLHASTKRWIKAVLMFLIAVIIALSFLAKAGIAGQGLALLLHLLFGDSPLTTTTTVLALLLSGFIFIRSPKKVKFLTAILAVLMLVIGVSGISANQHLNMTQQGLVGLVSGLINKFFGLLVADIVAGVMIIIAMLIFLQMIWQQPDPEAKKLAEALLPPKNSVEPVLKIRGIEDVKQTTEKPKLSLFKNKTPDKTEKPVLAPVSIKGKYSLPPLDLLSKNESVPTSGNIKENSLIIKKTFENFGIPVEMAEVNVGPAVTQYAFKPAEGVKLSKITTLSNNLALALAAHPIRIEAPIPGKSLVGIEVPNKVRATVSLRNLVESPNYHSSSDVLSIALGKDVSGLPVYTDLAEMPHMLVAGATGTGKTIFLNSLILSLLYKSTPDNLRMIMVDPKRVEFQHYNDIPHLLCPVIYDASKTMNALQWLVREMERRFEVFSEVPTRNLKSYNANKQVIASGSQLPYIVLVIDELADLMAAKGRELEAGIVRLAQMARATGIHLVLATQRPSVEVITGLIKANVSSRISFQVASQVDSRTVLDTAGAEKLLGLGDMLFVSSKSSKITRIQGPYISEKEVKRVTDWEAEQSKLVQEPQAMLIESLKEALDRQVTEGKDEGGGEFFGDEDPLYEDVKRIVLETQKASASFLQRRLRIGYARAARLIDMLEEKGIVGPADGAKPREVFGNLATAGPDKASLADTLGPLPEQGEAPEDGWQKV